jgi:hypothetical protein
MDYNKTAERINEIVEDKRQVAIATRIAIDNFNDNLGHAINLYNDLNDRVWDRLTDIFCDSEVYVSEFPGIEDMDRPNVEVEDYQDAHGKMRKRAFLYNHVWLYPPWTKRHEYNLVAYEYLMSHNLSEDEELNIAYNGKSLSFRKKMYSGKSDEQSSMYHMARLTVSMDVSIPEEDIWMLKALGKIQTKETTHTEQVVVCSK